jgi:hypothetical protein
LRACRMDRGRQPFSTDDSVVNSNEVTTGSLLPFSATSGTNLRPDP